MGLCEDFKSRTFALQIKDVQKLLYSSLGVFIDAMQLRPEFRLKTIFFEFEFYPQMSTYAPNDLVIACVNDILTVKCFDSFSCLLFCCLLCHISFDIGNKQQY